MGKKKGGGKRQEENPQGTGGQPPESGAGAAQQQPHSSASSQRGFGRGRGQDHDRRQDFGPMLREENFPSLGGASRGQSSEQSSRTQFSDEARGGRGGGRGGRGGGDRGRGGWGQDVYQPSQGGERGGYGGERGGRGGERGGRGGERGGRGGERGGRGGERGGRGGERGGRGGERGGRGGERGGRGGERGGRGGERGGRGGERGGRGGGDRGRGWRQQDVYQPSEVVPGYSPLPHSPSTSSVSSVISEGRQVPSHTPTPPPSQAGEAGPSQPPQQPSYQPPSEISSVTQKVSKMSVGPQSMIPLRKSKGPEVGTRGRKIPLEVNHLAISIKNSNMVAIHYDVSFNPDKPKRLYRLIMQAFQKKVYPSKFPAFDGKKNLYSCGYLPFGQVVTDTVKIRNEERQQDCEYEVTVKFASKVDMSPLVDYMNRGSSTKPPQEAIQALDIVLRSPAALRFVPVGRNFFTPPRGEIVDLGDGLELWYGFYQSAILGWKPFLNVDVAHKGFPKPENLIKVIKDMSGLQDQDLQRSELDDRTKESFQKYVGGLKVEYEIPRQPNSKRTYKLNKVMGSCLRQRFLLEKDGKKQEISVGEYFERVKGYRLVFPHMPCVHVGPPLKNIYIPVELCRIAPGQALLRKLNEKQTAVMVRSAAQPADVRKRRIMDAIRNADFNRDRTVQEFGINVSDRFTAVNGRVLDPPSLKYKQREIVPERGVWRSNQFLIGKGLNNWCILNCDDRTRDDVLVKLGRELSQIGQSLGCSINPNPTIKSMNKRSYSIRREDVAEKLHQCRKEGHEMVVVVIPDAGVVYGKVKQAAELQVGMLTQCLKSSTVFRKLNAATVTNILLKVNSKLNGVNHTIGSRNRPMVLTRPIMVVGADVTHPSPDQTSIPSVAAVAASHDANAFSYNMLWRLQPPRTEIIVDLENIMKAQLMFFFKKTNGYKPERIFFYRDGVSEGQFMEVLNKELQAIRRACSALAADFKPKITFLVVQKRHHTRFFPTRREDEDGKNRNVPAGTIVDTTITHPTEFDFYLASHASIQGTSRPTKYHLLWDDNDMNEDDLEELTYYLCHLFTRCTRSVSYPAPTYYAHLAAFRARVYLEGQSVKLSNLQHEQSSRTINDNIVQNSPMFFV